MSVSRAPSPPRKIRHVKKPFYDRIEPWLFLLPALTVFAIFLFYPFGKTVYLSTYRTYSPVPGPANSGTACGSRYGSCSS